jgi:hypothetical protein
LVSIEALLLTTLIAVVVVGTIASSLIIAIYIILVLVVVISLRLDSIASICWGWWLRLVRIWLVISIILRLLSSWVKWSNITRGE